MSTSKMLLPLSRDPVDLHGRMTLSHHMKRQVRATMRAHDEVLSKARSRLDTHCTAAAKLNMKNREALRRERLKVHATTPDEPLTLHYEMSHHTLREWRLRYEAHRRRRDSVKASIDNEVAHHAKQYRIVRTRRRKLAKLPVTICCDKIETHQESDPFETIINAWKPVDRPSSHRPRCRHNNKVVPTTEEPWWLSTGETSRHHRQRPGTAHPHS